MSENVISQEMIAVAFKAPSGQVAAYLNNFMAPTGVDNLGAGTVNATQNWWGCAGGPNTACGMVTGSGVTSSALAHQPVHQHAASALRNSSASSERRRQRGDDFSYRSFGQHNFNRQHLHYYLEPDHFERVPIDLNQHWDAHIRLDAIAWLQRRH